MICKLAQLTAVAALFSATAFADDAGLYQGVFDPNSSFIRVVAPGESIVAIDGQTLRDMEAGVSGFVNVMPGDIPVSASLASTSVSAGPGAHYTLIMRDDQTMAVLEDAIINDPAKADVTLYNLTDTAAVELFVPQANATAIEAVDTMSGETVGLRAPLTLDFEVRADGETLATVSALDLQRGVGVSIVLIETDGTYSATATTNSYLK